VGAIIGNSSHGQQQLAAYAAGRTVCEWADKNLGALNETNANVIKAYVNSGTIRWRNTYGRGWRKINRRSIDIATTNNEAILTVYLGVRRLPIVDLKLWRTNKTAPASVIAQNHNTELDWLVEHRDVVLALAYREGLWKGSLAPPPALLKMMYEKSESYTRFENWQLMLELAMAPFASMVQQAPKETIAVPRGELSLWAETTIKARTTTPNAIGRYMTTLGWGSMIRHVRGTTNIPERMRVLEGEEARKGRGQDSKDPVVTLVLLYNNDLRKFCAHSAQDYDERHEIAKDEKDKSDTPF
jgi:hypothetical protein